MSRINRVSSEKSPIHIPEIGLVNFGEYAQRLVVVPRFEGDTDPHTGIARLTVTNDKDRLPCVKRTIRLGYIGVGYECLFDNCLVVPIIGVPGEKASFDPHRPSRIESYLSFWSEDGDLEEIYRWRNNNPPFTLVCRSSNPRNGLLHEEHVKGFFYGNEFAKRTHIICPFYEEGVPFLG